jgi:protein-S-isoprenylcysteine O-methyltransferase Ste14/uncharacterized membrane protein (UPF0127 family)
LSDAAVHCRVTVVGNGAVLADRVRTAHTHWTRLRGLLGTSGLEPGGGLWLQPCRQVHMIGMRYPIDVAFLDDELQVVQTVADLRPGTISPKVVRATSVLELRSGRLAALGITSGDRLAISAAPGAATGAAGFPAVLLNVFLALLYAFFASAHVAAGWRTGDWLMVGPIVIQESLLMALFLTRRPSRAVAENPTAWVVGVLGTFLPLLFRPIEPSGTAVIGAPIQILGMVLVVFAVSSLGRSIGIVPAHRGIKTAGMYTFVRHPMYTAHLVAYAGYVLSFPSLRNVLIGVTTALALSLRAAFEEQLLTHDPHYAAYARRVTWRFLPHIY